MSHLWGHGGWCVILIILAACLGLLWGAQVQAQGDLSPLGDVIADRLVQRVDFPGIEEDPELPLIQVLERFTKLYRVPFQINEKAFKFENPAADIPQICITERGAIRAIPNARLDRVLRQVLYRIPSSSGASFLVRSDHVEITTIEFVQAEFWDWQHAKGPLLPLVHATIERRPLREALRTLADRADFNILLDVRASAARNLVTGRFRNVPLDTAVALLADQADLSPVLVDNVLYVTTPRHAKFLLARAEKHRSKAPVQRPLEDALSYPTITSDWFAPHAGNHWTAPRITEGLLLGNRK
jgi:hypothetical protein